jgi:hypothetical protein
MGDVIQLNRKSKGEKPPQMVAGVFYDLDPPAVIHGKVFRRVMCEYQVPAKPNEYVVKGIPDGATDPESFLLIFTGNGKVIPKQSEDQDGF